MEQEALDGENIESEMITEKFSADMFRGFNEDYLNNKQIEKKKEKLLSELS